MENELKKILAKEQYSNIENPHIFLFASKLLVQELTVVNQALEKIKPSGLLTIVIANELAMKQEFVLWTMLCTGLLPPRSRSGSQ